MKRRYTGIGLAVALLALGAAIAVVSCGTEQPGTNGPSEEYFPSSPGQKWLYDTYNLRRDPGRTRPFYTHVSIETIAPSPGLPLEPIWVTKYAAHGSGDRLRLNQAGYWVNKDIFFKYEYFTYGTGLFYLRGYHYLNEFRDQVIGTYYYDQNNRKSPFTLFKVPFELNKTWDVLNYVNPDPINNPTVYRNIDQKDYFGLARDMDGDGLTDDMDISITGSVVGRELIETDMGTLNCFQIELTQSILFHMTQQGDVPDNSKTTYWIAPYHGIAKVRWYEGSTYLDPIEMILRTWWFIK